MEILSIHKINIEVNKVNPHSTKQAHKICCLSKEGKSILRENKKQNAEINERT